MNLTRCWSRSQDRTGSYLDAFFRLSSLSCILHCGLSSSHARSRSTQAEQGPAPNSNMYAGLTDECWVHVLKHVKRPVPPVNSGIDAQIGQDDLATCMRVSTVRLSFVLYLFLAHQSSARFCITDESDNIHSPSMGPN